MSEKKPIKMAIGGQLKGPFSSASTEKEDDSTPYWKRKGYAKWAQPSTSQVPNDPSNQINRAKGEPQKVAPSVKFSNTEEGPVKTVTDGSSDVVLSHLARQPEKLPGFNGNPEKQHYPPCINNQCKSFGKSHPNCRCYSGPGGTSEEGNFAHGGCIGPHQESCEHFANGGQIAEQQRFLQDPNDALDHAAVQHGLVHLFTRTGQNGRSENPHKYLEDYHDSSRHGHKTLDSHMSKLLTKEKLEIEPNKEHREALKAHLDDLQANPAKSLEIGGSLGQSLPSHAAALGYKSAQAQNYLQQFKPQQDQSSPLDKVQPPSKMAENHYNRALDIANNPSLILKHVQQGTIQPSDLVTLQTLYPSLSQTMKSKAFEALVDAKTKGSKLPYHQKQGLSALLGQPLDSIQTPMAMQAIIKANSQSQPPESQKQPKKASGKELDQIDKTSEDFATPTQKRLMGKS